MTVKQFRDTELTNAGFSVSNKAAIGKTQYTTTRAVTTDVDLSNYKIDDLKNLTSLPNEINSGIITDYEMPGNNVSAIKINFNNSNFKDGYVVRAVGMYAKESGSDKEFLHSITVSDSPVYIPAVSGNVFDGFYLTMAIFTGNNKNISINISDETYVTTKRFNDAISDVTNIAKSSVQKSNFDEFKAKINDDFMAKINAIDLSKPEKNANNYTNGKVNEIKTANEDYTGVKNFKNGIKVSDKSIYVQDDKLMYEDKPLLVANAPNAPQLELSINRDTGNVEYKIIPPVVDGGASITGYKVYYKKVTDSDFTEIDINGDTLIGQFPTEKGKEYLAFVKAKNYAGDGYNSDTKKIIAGTEPKDVSINIEDYDYNRFKINFSVIDNGGVEINNYVLMYKKIEDTNWSQIHSSSENIFVDAKILSRYIFYGIAYNGVGSIESEKVKKIKRDPRIFGVKLSSNSVYEKTDEYKTVNINDVDYYKTNLKKDDVANLLTMFSINTFYIYKDDNTLKVSGVSHGDGWYLPACFYNYETNEEFNSIEVSNAEYQGNFSSIQNIPAGSYQYSINDTRNNIKSKFPSNYGIFDIHMLDAIHTLVVIRRYAISSAAEIKNFYGMSLGFNYTIVDGINTNGNSGNYNCVVAFDKRDYNSKNLGAPYVTIPNYLLKHNELMFNLANNGANGGQSYGVGISSTSNNMMVHCDNANGYIITKQNE